MNGTTTSSPSDQPRRFTKRFRATRVLKAGPAGETLRGIDTSDGREVVIRTVANPDPGATARLEYELAALSSLDGTDLVRPIAAGRQGAVLYSVLPYVPGVTLEAHLGEVGAPLSVAEALTVGQGVLDALAVAHEHGFVHRDVRPSNIIVDDAAAGVRRVTLVDFGVSQLRRVAGSPPETGLRAARYTSPEAAGLVTHEVDGRSDLYSAGALLFECLAGRPLFQGGTVGDVLRQHVTEAVPSLRSLGIAVPGALDQVVARLLMKEPADRYSSARAALADLEQIAVAVRAGRSDPSVVVGALDTRRTLTAPAFVGREEELTAIEAQLEGARNGRGALVLVEGESGGGKTKLLEELAQRSAERGIWVLRGQGVDQMAQRPLRVLDGVVDAVVRRAAADPDFAGAVVDALGGQLEALVDALPALTATFGPAETGSLGPEAYGEARSLPALTAFLDALATAGAPALVVLDDCQWADELTLKLIAHWATHRPDVEDARRVVVVAAFRSEEAPPGHPLRDLDPSVHVVLPALGDDDMRRILVSMAGPLPDQAVEVIEQLSVGNPFMATAVLRGLVETGALVEAPGGWGVEPAAMATVQTSRHAAAFLSRRLDLLPPAARRLLAVGALLGKEFDPTMAASLLGLDAEQAADGIEEARRRHILWLSGDHCTFVHDKLREALLGQLEEGDRRALHRDAALAFEARAPERVFELAYHFDAAGDAGRALPYALAAADRARSQHALEIAERQYRIAERGAAADDTRRQVAEGLGDVLMLRGRYEQAAAQLTVAARLAGDVVARAAIEGKLGELAFKRGDVATASEAVERAVRLLGRRMPRRSIGFLFSALGEIVVQLLHTVAPRRFTGRRRPEGADAELLAVRLYSRLAYIYWFQRGRVPCLWAHLREMNLAERYPASAELAQAYSEHAPVMTMIPWFSRGRAYGEKSLQIRTDLGDLWGQGQSLHFIGVVLYAASRYQDCIDHCRRAAALLDRTGDCWESNTARWHIAFSQYRLGQLAEAVESSRLVRAAAVEIGDHQAAGIALSAWAKASSGDVPADLIQGDLDRLGEDVHTAAEVLQAEAVRLLGAGRPADAASVLVRAARMVAAKGLKQEYVAPIQAWLATALRLEAEATSPWSPRHRHVLRRARRAARRARRVARSYPNNLPHALRESALIAGMSGRARRARRRFDASLAVAERQGARHEHAQTQLARGLMGVDLGWPDAPTQLAAARQAMAALTPVPAEPADAGEVTLSLLDRFDSLLGVGQQIASALTPTAVYTAVREAALTLLRAEDCAVLALGGGDDPDTNLVAGSHAQVPSPDLVARALAAGRPVLLETAGGGGGDSDNPVRSALCAPVYNRGRAVACCYLTHGQVGALFGEEEVRLAEFVATLAGTALENAEGFAEVQALSRSLEQRVEERTTELAEANRQLTERSEAVALLRTIAVATNEASTVEAALQVALDEVCRHTGWPVGHFCRVADDRPGEASPTAIWHLDDPARFATFKRVTEVTTLPFGTGLPGRVAATGAPVWIPDVLADSNFPRARAGEDIGVRGAFAVALLAGSEVVGVLEFFSPDPAPLDQRLLDLVAQVGTELGRVAERKRAEDALRHSEERTRSILAAANDAFIGMDEGGAITDWNRSAEAIFGWGRDEVIGRQLADVIVPIDFRPAHDAGIRRFMETGVGPVLGKRIELAALHRDGREFPAELSIWHIATGKKHLFNAFVQDISERKQTEQALAVARDQAMEASRMKSQFLATMSHEIRTPMNGVIGLAELLLQTDLAADQRPYAEGLRSAGEALLAVINDILDFSKIEAGKLELEDVGFDPRHLVDEVVQLMAPTAHAKGLELVGVCGPTLPAGLRGDPGRLRQILVNLTSNAVKFTDAGEVVVRVDAIGGSAGDWTTVRLQVTDTGIGIAPADQRHVLEPFSQADASTTRRYGGTGLGLAICRQLAEAMGGTLSLESEAGKGSTFGVTVPLGRQWDGPGRPAPAPELRGVRVLVVDDNVTARTALVAELDGWGMRPVGAAGAAEALALMADGGAGGDRFEVAVVDAAMPGTDGLELARQIGEVPALGRMRVLLLTTGRPIDVATAARLGIGAAVAKPVVVGDLSQALARLVGAPPSTVRPPGGADGAGGDPIHPAPAPAATGTSARGRVLVVEDNTTNQMVAVGLLSRLGFETEVVSNGRQAVDAVSRTGYDAVLMDCNMPVMDGYEATATIRGLEAATGGVHVPIVAMTAGALVGDRERCLAVGMDDYVSKPVTLGELDRVLSRCLPAVASAPASEAVDTEQLASLRALDDGDGKFLATLLGSFLASSTRSLQTLAAAVETGDVDTMAREAHRLRGEAATLGATGVAALCGELEAMPAPVDRAAAGAVLTRAEDEMVRVRERLQAELGAAQVS